MINCVVIDDEPLAREGIKAYLQKVDFLNFIGEGANPTEIHKISEKQTIDLIFLDIQMPLMTGLDYLKNTANRPMVILTTAYSSYALESFELDVLDYLVKPITFARFHKSAVKAKDYFQLTTKGDSTSHKQIDNTYFFIKCDYVYEKIKIEDLEYIQAQQNYVVFHTREQKYMTLMPLKHIWDMLPTSRFIQVHKSFVVAIDKIMTLEKTRIKLTMATIPLSRNYKENVHKVVLKRSVFKK
ncbi:LytR/AlgR family response regulator transcription factor [Croceitalea marina]|uniref:LytR/AlgR family response regulator transcription factor n=1 Tax=Croceitalea marina TaxID=1775166 RepID=A0ABW5MQW1_9FLAO